MFQLRDKTLVFDVTRSLAVNMIENLVVVAAPSCCGKTKFITDLRHGRLPEVKRELFGGEFVSWKFVDAYYLTDSVFEELQKGQTKNLLLHWTISRPSLRLSLRNLFLRGAYDKSARLATIAHADNKISITLCARRSTLLQRVDLRIKKVVGRWHDREESIASYLGKRIQLFGLKRFYRNPQLLKATYIEWQEFCAAVDFSERLNIDVTSGVEIVTAEFPLEDITA